MPTINKPKKKTTIKNNQQKAIAQKYVYHTTIWEHLRLLKLINNPLCESCLLTDRVEPAVEVHHITPFMQGTTIEQIRYLGFDYYNLMSLCAKCHDKIHQAK